MGIIEAERLQQQIDSIVLAAQGAPRIVLEHGSECTNLAANVALRVFEGTAVEYRQFTIVTARWVHDLLNDQEKMPDWLAEAQGIYCTGGPLIIVREINADVIVRAVRRYRLMETGS